VMRWARVTWPRAIPSTNSFVVTHWNRSTTSYWIRGMMGESSAEGAPDLGQE
jgi:hypothetical protein